MLYNFCMKPLRLLILFTALALAASCAPSGTVNLPAVTQPPATLTASPPAPTLAPTLTHLPTDTLTPTITFTPTETPTATVTPAPVKLMGTVLEHSNCRYGPGAVFLYKYGLLPTSRMEIAGRDQAGTWLLIHSRGGDDFCWLKAALMDADGDVLTVPEVDPDIILPRSAYYPNPLTGVEAHRNGGKVIVFWNELVTKAGDEIKLEASQTLYVIEAWVCKEGRIAFTVVGSNELSARVPDEPGCSEPSHGRVYGADKHGYTPPAEIPWPGR
jgi:hypothetical protein